MSSPRLDPAPRGHQELIVDLPPYLLEVAKPWHIGAWLPPPAFALSWASAFVFVFILVLVRMDPLRSALFRFPSLGLPFPFDHYYLVVPLLSLGLALLIFWQCAQRPGGRFPHYWCLALIAISGFTFLYGIFDRLRINAYRGSPIVHLLSAASLFAGIALLPRLVRVYPDSRWVQNAAFLSLAVGLGLGVTLALYMSYVVTGQERERVTHAGENVRSLARQLRAAVSRDWQSPEALPQSISIDLDKLSQLHLSSLLPDPYVWQAAKILGQSGNLKAGCDELISSVLAAVTKTPPAHIQVAPVRFGNNGQLKDQPRGYASAASAAAPRPPPLATPAAGPQTQPAAWRRSPPRC